METIERIRHQAKRALLRLGFYKMPHFLIIGAQKSGTTFLYSVIRQHPQIIEPVHKEAHFFDYEKNYSKGIFQYHLNFDLSFRFKKNQYTFEATPDYIAHPLAAKRIHEQTPSIKLILILREPVSRAISAWKMHHYKFKDHPKHSWLYDPRTLEQVINDSLNPASNPWDLMNHFGRSLYGLQVENLFKHFPREQVLILFQNELLNHTQETIDKVLSFLELAPMHLRDVDTKSERFWDNKSTSDEVQLSEEQLIRLKNYYSPDQEKLERIINKNVDW